MTKKAIIIGAGPAGLTAAYELLQRTDIVPVILEKSAEIGGLSKTVNYKGNRIDIGGHRFFSKSDRVMDWWLNIMPLDSADGSPQVSYQNQVRTVKPKQDRGAIEGPKMRMLVRNRISRIYFLRKFFSYPIQLSVDTLKKLGLIRTIQIMASYFFARLFPKSPEKNLEDFFVNRFGGKLYRLFFKDYTEKVWGVPCIEISAEWGAQRIKGISIAKALTHAIKSIRPKVAPASVGVGQQQMETSLIEKFLYPKFGPGQLWEEVARQVVEMGGEIHFQQDVRRIHSFGQLITAVETVDADTGRTGFYTGDYFFSTMPVQELIEGMGGAVPSEVSAVAAGLKYRDFITVGVLLSKVAAEKKFPDTWIYIQEKDVKVGRLQIFNNWSPWMVLDPETVWIGMEYFCNKSDSFWRLTDEEIKAIAISELVKMGLAKSGNLLDSTVLRVEKTYPAYLGTYHRFDEIRQFTDGFANLFLIGRNGMHKYNNADHSMLSAMVAVDDILAGVTNKANIWAINTEQQYHEEATPSTTPDQESQNRKPRPSPQPAFEGQGFIAYLWRRPWNRRLLFVAICLSLIQFIVFKTRYPYANYMPDSYYYLDAASTNVDVNIWPVAYSKFLRQISVFTHMDIAVVFFQYAAIVIGGLFLTFSLSYLLKFGKPVQGILIAFFVLNPISLYISNYVSADALFIGLSFVWFAELVWIIYEPGRRHIFLQPVVLLACFTLRYNAIYYPFLAAFAYALCRYDWKTKAAAVLVTIIAVGSSMLYTTKKMYDATGQRQFSAFAGWQLANNALYMYQNIPASERTPVPSKFAELELMVRQHIDTLGKVKLTKDDTISAHFYLWSEKGPLVQYMVRKFRKDSTSSYFRRWASEGPLYADYGLYLIRKYPAGFFKSFIWPNTGRYITPPTEFLGIYNMGSDSVGNIVKQWFNYKSQRIVEDRHGSAKVKIAGIYQTFSTLANTFLIVCLFGLCLLRNIAREHRRLLKLVLLGGSLWIMNILFSITASPVTLRYQIFPVSVFFTVGLVVASEIYKSGSKMVQIKA